MTKNVWKSLGGMLVVGMLSATLFAQSPAAAARYDNQIQPAIEHKLATKKQLSDVKSRVEDGIVTLTGTVDLYQRKLDAAKLARKTSNVQGAPCCTSVTIWSATRTNPVRSRIVGFATTL